MSFDKAAYGRREPVSFRLTLENTGREALWVNTRFHLNSREASIEDREVALVIISPSSRILPCKFSDTTGLPRSDDFVLVEPGQSVASAGGQDLRTYADLPEPGTYQIVALYDNIFGDELEIPAFRGTLASEPVKFEIAP